MTFVPLKLRSEQILFLVIKEDDWLTTLKYNKK